MARRRKVAVVAYLGEEEGGGGGTVLCVGPVGALGGISVVCFNNI